MTNLAKNAIKDSEKGGIEFGNNLKTEIAQNVLPFFVKETTVQIKKLKILIAEDDESSAFLLSEIVKKYCSEIFYAITGVEAVEVYLKHPDIDLILMDIQMPVMNGREATRRIRHFNKEIIIIAQSGLVFNSDREKALDAGCNDIITKPLNHALLNELLIKYFKI